MARLLVVDDDAELTALLGEYLAGEGFEVIAAGDGESGVRAALEGSPDLVVLDVMLPRLNGFDALRRIRERSAVPVIMLTARGDEVDRIVGLELGADDYLAKPFNPRELAARVRAVLRRSHGQLPGGAGRVVVGDLEVDPSARQVRRGGEKVELTGTEFSLLALLAREAGNVVTRQVLYREVLGRRPLAYDRSLDVHVSNLRRKLGPLPGGEERIKTLRGVGYQYVRVEG
jgi:DNA-binding response OmpR family regulator